MNAFCRWAWMMSIWWLLQRLATDRMAAGLYLWPCSVMISAWIGSDLGLGRRAQTRLSMRSAGMRSTTPFTTKGRTAVTQMIDHM